MDSQQLQSYLDEVKELTPLIETESTAQEQLLTLIDRQLANAEENSSARHFFQGELNFYNKNYEDALRHYIEAKEIPQCLFFCYRASSFMSEQRGQTELAGSYASKALALCHDDFMLQNLLPTLPKASATEISTNRSEEDELNQNVDLKTFCAQPQEGASSSPLPMDALQATYQHETSPLSDLMKYANSNTDLEAHLGPSTIANEESGSEELKMRIDSFNALQTQLLKEYLLQANKNKKTADNCLYTLHGWRFEPPFNHHTAHPLFTEEARQSRGGYYIRWNNKGIAINPGSGFVDSLHQQGLSTRDIDAVIVCSAQAEAHADLKSIYELNNQLNKISPEAHVIHYYLHHRAYRDLSPLLKPTSKLARHTIHNLEMFDDSPEVEKIEISDDVTLHYFLTSPQETNYAYKPSFEQDLTNNFTLGIRLELRDPSPEATAAKPAVLLGYIATMKWTPLIAHYLGRCNVLLAGFGNTSHSDYSQLSYNEDSLGYHGVFSLLEEVAPQVLLLTEFGGREGDIRLEVAKKLRNNCLKCTHLSSRPPIIFPVDIGFQLDLNSMSVRCSLSENSVDLQHVRVIAAHESFGRLRYLSEHYCL